MEYKRLLKIGSRGEDVKAVQTALHCLPDGIFGDLTTEAVKDWQEEHGLGVDGIVGRLTWDTHPSQLGVDLMGRVAMSYLKSYVEP